MFHISETTLQWPASKSCISATYERSTAVWVYAFFVLAQICDIVSRFALVKETRFGNSQRFFIRKGKTGNVQHMWHMLLGSEELWFIQIT
jgi:hypothetical protein